MTTSSKQFSLFPEGFHQGWTATHPAQRLAGSPSELGKVLRAEIRQFMLLAISPDVFDRIKFRRIGGQTLQMDAAVLLSDVFPDQPAAVRRQTIPDDRERSADVLLEMFEKFDHLRGLDAAGEKSEVEIPNGDAGDGRKTVPVEGILQHWRLTARSPGSDPMRPLAQSAFVHKNYGSALLERFFLISGQITRFHCKIAGSSRWVARPIGRWQLQPRERKIRQTCPG